MRQCLIFLSFCAFLLAACQQAESDYFPEESQVTHSVMNDSVYSVDSAEVVMLHRKLWDYANYGFKADSMIAVAREGLRTVSPLLEYRLDTFLAKTYGDFLSGEGYGLTAQGFPFQGIKRFEETITWEREHNYDGGISLGQTHVGMAGVFMSIGDYEKGLSYMKNASFFTTIAFEEGHYYHPMSQANIGEAYLQSGDLDRGYEEYCKALGMAKGEHNLLYHKYLITLADILLKKGRPDEAEKYLMEFREKGIPELNGPESSFYWVLTSRYYYQKGRMHHQQKEASQALHYYENAGLMTLNPSGVYDFTLGSLRADINFQRALLLRELGQKRPAIEAFRKASRLAQEFEGSLTFLKLSTEIEAELGQYLLDLGEHQDALDQTHKMLSVVFPNLDSTQVLQNPDPEQLAVHIQALPLLDIKAKAWIHLYEETEDTRFLDHSREIYRLGLMALEIAQFRFRTPTSKRWIQEKAAPFMEGAVQVVLLSLEKTDYSTGLADLLDLLQRKKSGALLSRMLEIKAKGFVNIPPELKEREHDLQNELSYYLRMSSQEEHKPAGERDSVKLSQWWSYQLDAQVALDSVHEVLQENFPKFQDLQQSLEMATIPELQKFLRREKAVLLDYFLGDSTLVIFGINQEESFFHYRVIDSALKEQINDFRHLAGSPKGALEEFAGLGHSLYKQLLEPVAPHLDQPNLIIIPDGQLGYLPFHLLLTGAEGSSFRDLPYLFRDYAIRYEYASSLLLQHWDRPKPEHTYAGFAPQYQGNELTALRSLDDSLLMARLYDETLLCEGLSPLQNNREEVGFAAGTMKGVYFEGQEALESTFKAVAPRSNVVHLAMHALTNDVEPIYSQLIFSQEPDTLEDGKLYAYELYNMNLEADLAVLSACETGAGKVQSGEGVMSLSHAFKYAGCPNIVMSLWQAHDRSSSEMVSGFFRHLKKGEGKADALRHAGLEFLNSADERYTHPFYWGGMVLVGDNESLGAGWNLKHAIIAMFLAGIVGFWEFRKKISARHM